MSAKSKVSNFHRGFTVRVGYLVALALFFGCSTPLKVVQDPFSNQALVSFKVDQGNDYLFEVVNGALDVESIEFRANKKNGNLENKKMIWRVISNQKFELINPKVEISIAGETIPLKMMELGRDVETTVRTESESIGTGFVLKSGLLAGVAIGGTSGTSTSKAENRYIAVFETEYPPEMGKAIRRSKFDEKIFLKMTTKTINGEIVCLWNNYRGNGNFGIYKNFKDYFTKIDAN